MKKQRSLSEVTAGYRSLYGGFESWEQLLLDVQANLYEAYALNALVQELRAHGSFRNPVVLGLDEDWGDRKERNSKPIATYPAVLDGTKRVLAHMIVGSQFIEVDDRGAEQYYVGENLDRYNMYTKVEIPLPLINVRDSLLTITADSESQTRELDLWDGLMSLRVDEHHWLSSLTSGSQQEGDLLWYSFSWNADALLVPKPLINNAMLAQIRDFGFDVSRVKVHTVIEDWAKDAPVEVEQGALKHLLSGFGDPSGD